MMSTCLIIGACKVYGDWGDGWDDYRKQEEEMARLESLKHLHALMDMALETNHPALLQLVQISLAAKYHCQF